jgi:uncharacterized membrane protein YhaH (DUF805 family)
MRGTIVAIAPDGTYGQLSAEDGQRYSYWTSEVRNGPPQVGQQVDFQIWEGQPVDIFVMGGAVAPPPGAPPYRPGMPQAAGYAQGAPAYAGGPHAPAQAQAGAYRPGAGFPPAAYWIKLLTSPSGRISRLQFWLHGILPIFLANILLGWIPLIGQLIALALLWSSICISFKRFHDVGYPGWWCLLNFIPVFLATFLTIGAFLSDTLSFAWLPAQILWGLSVVIFLVQLIFVYLRAGEPGPNKYGPDPLAAG